MKTTRLLQTLKNQLAELALQVAPLSSHATLSPRFDRQLFRTRDTQMQAYLDEAQHNLAELQHAVEHQHLPQVARLAERLVAQIAAISRETATVVTPMGQRLADAKPLATPPPAAPGSMSAACWQCATIANVSWRRQLPLPNSNG